MRNAFAAALVNAARSDARVLLLTGDHGYSLFDDFRQVCPDQYVNAGVAEQNMVGVAAGLAKGGFRPVVYGLSSFVPIRVLEQIKMDVCYENLPVVFIGDGAGVVYSALGSSHQSTEDVACLRAVPNLAILSPADDLEMTAAMNLALTHNGPVYVRMGKADLGRVHPKTPVLQWGAMLPVRDGDGPLVWLATGSMVQTALAASVEWPRSAVWSAPCLKPLNVKSVASLCARYKAVVVLEEHSIHGGFASAVAQATAEYAPIWVCPVGIQDCFSRLCGSYQYLMREHGLDVESVKTRVRNFVAHLPSGRKPAVLADPPIHGNWRPTLGN
jgi:transketolase